jgi:hypothetical protein
LDGWRLIVHVDLHGQSRLLQQAIRSGMRETNYLYMRRS